MLLQLSDSGTSVSQDHMHSDQVVSKIFLLQGFYESSLMSWIRLYELKIYTFYILVCFYDENTKISTTADPVSACSWS